ncbi:MFS transporter [Dactylosporangium sp. NBC_01737]|uniref:MFS transporter n=1 Tax=Dactylosporangium sp. NBC_01737 TaxID=2975959 RepID=UPI002E108DA5|nr:MFS transporter [Dactylosporangium sp. NBC_01737]
MPLYPLYALLFTDTGLGDGQISLLFALWSGVGLLAEVPTGALADRFSRRGALVAAGVLQAVAFAVWTAAPGGWVFAAGFVLWGVGGALSSGALEALLYDGLVAAGAEDRYARVSGQVAAAGLIAQIPAAGAAVVLFPLGGYALVGWVSVGICLCAAALALRLEQPGKAPDDEDDDHWGYFATLGDGIGQAARAPAVRAAILALAALAGLDAIDEYFPVMAAGWGVPTGLNPALVLVVTLGGAAGAGIVAYTGTSRPAVQATLLAVAGVALAAAGVLRLPVGVVLVAVFYGLYRYVLVLVDARLQHVIEGASRATVTSVAALATEVSALALFGAWAAGGVLLVAALTALLALIPLSAGSAGSRR